MITLRKQSISIIPNLLLILSIAGSNYLGGVVAGTISFFIFVTFFSMLFLLSPVHAFVFSFIQNLDIFGSARYPGSEIITIVCMFLVFSLNLKHFISIFKDNQLKRVVYITLAFSIYGLLNIAIHNPLTKENILPYLGYILGFWTILPAYYFTLYKRKELFTSFTIIAGLFVLLYFLNLAFDLNIINVSESEREGTGSTRLMGYDVRQFIILFFYLIPAFLLSRNLSRTTKILGVSIGLFAYLIIVLALYRLAMFYVGMGMLLSVYYISQYTDTKRIIKLISLGIITIIILLISFSSFISDIANIFLWTLDFFSGNARDASAEARFDYQLPVLINYITSNIFFGAGIGELISQMKEGYDMFGYVDFPILGTLAAFGTVGMILYYTRFYFILNNNRIKITEKNIFIIANHKMLFYIYLTLKAYFITMITFRLFYVSWELTFDYGQAEFGLFVGIFFALQYIFKR